MMDFTLKMMDFTLKKDGFYTVQLKLTHFRSAVVAGEPFFLVKWEGWERPFEVRKIDGF